MRRLGPCSCAVILVVALATVSAIISAIFHQRRHPSSSCPAAVPLGLAGSPPVVGVGLSLQFQTVPMNVAEAMQKLRSVNVGSVRLWDLNPETLQAALRNNIKSVYVTVPNDQIFPLASDSATDRIANVFKPFQTQGMKFVVGVGNEPTAPWEPTRYGMALPQAMRNLHRRLQRHGLDHDVKVSVPFDLSIMEKTYPPWEGRFGGADYEVIKEVAKVIQETESVFTVHLYPWFAWKSNSGSVNLKLALGLEGSVVSNCNYKNLLAQQVAAVRAALIDLDKDYGTLPLVVAETGWPSAGYDEATVENSCQFARSTIATAPSLDQHLHAIYYFSAFDESRKSARGHGGSSREEENHFGVFSEQGMLKCPGLDFPTLSTSLTLNNASLSQGQGQSQDQSQGQLSFADQGERDLGTISI